MKNCRFGIAALLAPLVAPVFLWLGMLMLRGGSYPGDSLIVGMVGASSYAGFFVFGLPSILVLRLVGKLTLLNVTLVGFLVGGALGQILPSLLLRRPDFAISFEPAVIMSYGVFGGIAAVSFGLIAAIKRV